MSRTTTLPSATATSRLRVASRVCAAVLGGYAFAWGAVALVTALLFAAGLDFHDAEFMGALLGLLAYLAVFLWTIATRRLARAWAALLAAGALMTGAASLLQSMLA